MTLVDRIKHLMKLNDLSASAFADKIGVQRSSISHILSGRNKPSLEFVLKVISTFPEVDLYWLLNGKGLFPAENSLNEKTEPSPILHINETQVNSQLKNDKSIEQIVIFYSDGSFKNFNN